MRKTGWIAALLTLVLALMLGAAAEAEEARVITRECAFKSSTTKFKRTQMMDDKFTNYWYTAKGKHNFFQLTAPAGDPIHGLYLCFKSMPDAYEVQVRQGGEWVTRYTGDTNYYHIYYDFPEGVETLRVYLPTNTSQVLGFNMIYAFSAGDTPDWVQRWEPPLEHADILFLAAHPDDDLIFFGGGIPTYAGERDLQVEVAYMSPSNTTRRSELLNALWALGVRHYPIIGPFADSYQKTVERQWEVLGGKDAVYSWVTEVFRRCRPDVVVTQDADGEYGHPMHKIVAQAARECVALAASEDRYPESLSAFGAWQVKKLYLHLWPENQSRFDWETPLEAFGGKTGIELADEAYTTYHYSQRASGMSVRETGSKYDNHLFGLCFTTVGPDVVGGDFMENIGGAALPVLEDSGAEDTPDGLTEEAPADGEPAAAPEEDGGEPEEA